VQNAPDVSVVVSAGLLEEALKLIRDGMLEFPRDQFALNTDDINDIISFISTATALSVICFHSVLCVRTHNK
jgi:hypothetical protein